MNEITDVLIEKYPLPHRLFGCTEEEYGTNEWIRRRLFANIIVGGSRDVQAVKAATVLFELYDFDYIANRKNHKELRRSIADLLEDEFDIRFAGKKADHILGTAYALSEIYNGVVPNDFNKLISFPGVGRHAASIVMGLAFNEPTFGVDLHVRRIAKRMRLVDEKATDRAIEKAFMEAENPTHISRAFMEFGSDICAYRPKCKQCPFNTGRCDPSILK